MMTKSKIFSLFCVLALPLLLFPARAAAQKGTVVTGTVKDRVSKEPLPGVAIFYQDSKDGVESDKEGRFSINRREKGGTLVFALLGYETRKISISSSQTSLDVTMVESSESLSDVVVTGYTPIHREGFSGNSTKISRDDLIKTNPNNILQAIQVFDPSFRLIENINAGSNPNVLPDMQLRGQTSISTTALESEDISRQTLTGNANLPIFILDGFEVSVEKIYDIDPTRIHSINILKDAAATAFYGSRAANGVIVIELRSPEAGRLRVQYNNTTTLEAPDLSSYNLMNACEKLEAERLAGLYDSSTPEISPYTNGYYKRMNNIIQGVDTYWLSLGLRNALDTRHSVYVDGGENDVRWGVELNGTFDNGVMQHSSRDVLSAGFYIDFRINRFQIKNKAYFSEEKSSNVPFNSFGDYSHLQPYFRVYDDDGYYRRELEDFPGYTGSLVNPLYEINNYSSYDKSNYKEVIDNLLVNWTITDALKLRFQFSATLTRRGSDTYKDPASASYGTSSLSLNGDKNTTSGDENTLEGTLQLMYNKSFRGHNVNLNLSGNVRQSETSLETANYRGFPGGDLTSINYSAQIVNKPSVSDNKTRLLGVLLTGNYTYQDLYFGDLTGRLDGSSEFGSDKRWSGFWAAGAGVNVHNYPFLKGNKTISMLRFRGSYGLTGKTNFSLYSARDMYQLRSEGWFPTGYGVYLSQMGNPDLKWEKTYKLDLGPEIGLWKDRLHFKASVYRERTVDLITDLSLPSSTGFTSRKENMGVVRNTGWELDLRVRAFQSGDWGLTLYGNMAHNRNRVVKISEAMDAYNKRVEEIFNSFNPSTSTDSRYSRPYLKYYEGASMTAIAGMKSLGISPSNGKEIYLKPNGEVTDQWSASDWTVIGDTAPDATGSFGFTLTYQRLTLYSAFLYRFGGDAYNSTLVNYVENVDLRNENVDRRVLLQRWQKPGDVTVMKDIRERNITTGSTSRFVQKDNTLQFNSLTLSYDFGKEVLKFLHSSMCRLSFTANDLFYLSTIRRERGLEYPYSRTFSFSLNISF